MGKQQKPYISTGLTNTIATGKGRGWPLGCYRVLGGGFLGLKVWLVGVLVGVGVNGWGQVIGDFQPKNATGNWSDFNAWNRHNGTSFVAATAGQIPTSTSDIYFVATRNISVDITTAVCNSIRLSTNGNSERITLNAGGILSIYGSLLQNSTNNIPFVSFGLGSKIIFTGTANQTITNSGANTSLGNVEINKSSGTFTLPGVNTRYDIFTLTSGTVVCASGAILLGLTSASTVNVNGGTWTQIVGANRINGGGGGIDIALSINGGTMTLATTSGGAAGFNFSSINITNGGTLNMNSSTGNFNVTNTFTIDATSTVNSTYVTTPSATTNNFLGTFNYNAAGNQNIINTTYGNLGLLVSGTKSPAATLNITRDLTIGGSAILPLSSTIGVNIGGNWSSYGQGGLTESTSIVDFNGAGTQTINTVGGENFYLVRKSGSGTLTLNSNVSATGGAGSGLNISAGIVDAGINTLSGAGTSTLTMTGGTLRLGKPLEILPEFTGTYALSGGFIELSGAGNQVLRGGIAYNNLVFSGSSGNKTITSAISSIGSVTISGGNVVDVSNNTFGGTTTNFTMTAGRFRTQGTGTKPDMANDYNLTGGVVEFYGNAGTIRSKAYQNIEVTGTNVGNSSGNITLNSGGTFTVKTGGTFSINADAITGPGPNETVTIENGATFNCGNLEGLVGLPLTDPPFNSPAIRDNIETIVLASGSTINYTRATVSQKFTARTDYSNVTISGGGEKIVQGASAINGALTLTNGTVTVGSNTLTLNGSLSRTGGTLTLASNSSLVFGANAAALTIPNGTFTSAPTFQNLTINRAGGITLGNQPITLTGTLTLSNGLLNTTSTNLITLGTDASATGSATSFVNGPIAKQMASSSADIILPVGKSPGDFQPVTLADATGSGTNTFSAEYFPTGATTSPRNDDTNPGIVTGLWTTRYWQVDRTGTGVNLRIGLPYDPTVGGWTPLPPLAIHPVAVARFDITTDGWNFTRGSGAFNIAGPPPLEAIPNTASGTVYSDVLSSFSPFTIGYGAFTILPVTLLSFGATPAGGMVRLQWKVADAETLKHFVVELSQNGQHFEAIGTIFPQPVQEYTFTHHPLAKGDYFYRLKIVDKKGDVQYSEVKKVTLVNQPPLMITWQYAGLGSSVGYLQVKTPVPNTLHVVVYDALGRMVKTFRFQVGSGIMKYEVPLNFLSSGGYRLQVGDGQGNPIVFSFIK